MKRGVLPLNALRALESTLRLGQMARAADELGVTYGAVSRHIRRLERSLGIELFEGPRNRLTPTAAAKRLQPALGTAFDTLEAAVRHECEIERRPLDVSCLGMLAMRWLIPLLPDFHRLHPGIDVRLLTTETPDARMPRSGATITVGQGPWEAGAVPLFAERLGPIVHPSLLTPDRVEPADFSDLPFLHTRASPEIWPEWCRAHGTRATGVGLDFDTLPPMIEGALAGLGIGIAPEMVVQDDIRAGRLAAPFGFTPSGRDVVVRTATKPEEEAAIFASWLQSHIGIADR